MKQLSGATVRLITSSQVITSVASAVKELVENALDATATSIEVKVENYGLDKIEVRDNGSGVPRGDVQFMGQPHYTSKLSSAEDLENLCTYGFRGEALGSLCAVAEVSVTTKTPEDEVSFVYTLNHQGHVTGSKPSHLGQGTTICASNLFKNLPVRKQFYSSVKKKKESLKALEDLIVSFSVISPAVRFVLKHGKETLWQSSPVESSRLVLQKVLGGQVTSQLVHVQRKWEEPQFEVEAYLPDPSSVVSEMSRSDTERLFVYVNQRPVKLKSLEKLLKDQYSRSHGLDTQRFPVGFLHIQTPSKQLDVNLEPNKTKVMFHKQTELMLCLEEEIAKVFQKSPNTDSSTEGATKNSSTHKPHTESHGTSVNVCQGKELNHASPEVANTLLGGDCNANKHIVTTIAQSSGEKSVDLMDSTRTGEMDSLGAKTLNALNSTKPFESSSINQSCHLKSLVENTLQNNNGCIEQPRNLTDDSLNSHMSMKDSIQKTLADTGGMLNGRMESVNAKPANQRGLFSLDDSLGDLLLTNENIRNNTENRQEAGSFNFDSLIQNKSTNNSLSIGAKDLLDSNDNLSSISNDVEMLSSSNESNLITSTRVNSSEVQDHTEKEKGEGSSSKNDEKDKNGVKSGAISSLFNDDSDDDLMFLDIDTPVKEQMETKDTVESASGWSRGQAVSNTEGASVQPVKLLVPGTDNTGAGLISSMAKPTLSTDRNINTTITTPRNKSVTESPNQPTLFDLSGSNIMKKPTTAFITFSKEVRPKVVAENPGASFQEVGRLTGERWKSLTEEERQRYKEQSEADMKRFKQQQLQMKASSASPAMCSKPLKRKKPPSITSPQGCQTTSKCRAVLHEENVKFSMSVLKERLKLHQSQTSSPSQRGTDDVTLLSDIEVGDIRCWIGLHGNQVIAFQPIRAKELIIYHKLMQQHALPMEVLPEPIRLKQSDFPRPCLWETLQKLQRSEPGALDPYSHFTDVRLVKNGFKLRQLPDQNGDDVYVEIVSQTRVMNYFGKGDLFEILENIADITQKTGSCTLRHCRPTKVQHFLQAEAVRMARQLPVRVSGKEAQETLQYIHDGFPPNTNNCFHHKPFLLTLYDLCDIPMTQSQTPTQV